MLEEDYSEELDRLLEACECDLAVPSQWQQRSGPIPSIENDRRHSDRQYVSVNAVLEYGQSLPGIPREHTMAKVLTRDLSDNGVGFYYSQQLFPGERVSLWLSSGKRTFQIVRCVRHNENCFEVGATLVETSDADAAEPHFSGSVELP